MPKLIFGAEVVVPKFTHAKVRLLDLNLFSHFKIAKEMVTNSAPQKTWNSRKNHFKIQIQPKEMKNRLLVHHREMSFSRESSFTPLFHNSIKTRWLQNFI